MYIYIYIYIYMYIYRYFPFGLYKITCVDPRQQTTASCRALNKGYRNRHSYTYGRVTYTIISIEFQDITIIVRKQLLPITLLSIQDGGRHSGSGCLQRLFRTSMFLFDSLYASIWWFTVCQIYWRHKYVCLWGEIGIVTDDFDLAVW